MSDKLIVVDGFISPDKLFLDEPRGLRAVAFECLVRDFHKLFGDKLEEITQSIMKVYKIDRIEATIKAHYYFQQMRSVYSDEADALNKPLKETMYQAIEAEKDGDINSAIEKFEYVLAEGFPPSTPYERLRILYTKQGQYLEAIRVCEKYINILETIKQFWPNYSNIRLIPKIREHIHKLSKKLK